MNNFSSFGKHLHVLTSTGPHYINKQAIDSRVDYYKIPDVDIKGNCTICNLPNCNGGNVFYHVKGRSWNALDSLLINFMLCKFIFNPYFYILLTTLIILYYNTKK